MAGNLMRGDTQIQSQTIPLTALNPAIAIPDSYLANGVNYLKKDGSVTMTGNLNMGSNRLTGLASGIAVTDAVNLGQLQAVQNGVRLHFARFVMPANVSSLSGIPATGVADGVTAADGDVAFLIAQSTASQNGPWVIHSGSWTRPADWSSGSVYTEGHYWIIDPDGTNYKNTKWFLTATTSVTVDTTSVSFLQDQGGVSYSFSNGLSLSGSTVSTARGNGIGLDGSNNLTVTPDSARMLQTIAAGIGIKDGTAGQIMLANSAGNASWQTGSGDVTVSNSGVFTVNHAAGSGFLKYTDIVRSEVPGGTPNGTLTAFTLASAPQNTSLNLYKNGQLMKPGAGNDYTISGSSITMLSAPLTGEQLLADYVK